MDTPQGNPSESCSVVPSPHRGRSCAFLETSRHSEGNGIELQVMAKVKECLRCNMIPKVNQKADTTMGLA